MRGRLAVAWRRNRSLRVAAALLAAATTGAAFALAHLPLPWMLGPLAVTAGLRVAGVDVEAPPGARQAGQWVIGTALGLYFTPHVAREVLSLWHLFVAGAAYAVLVGYASGLALSRLGRVDRTTAVFASVPGGAAEMSVLGERFGARPDVVAAAQSMRVLLVVVTVPSVYAALGVHGVDPYAAGPADFSLPGFLVLMAATFAGGCALQALGVPNAFVLGPLAVAIPLTAGEVALSSLPAPVSAAGQLLLGCALGARFGPSFVHGARRLVAATVASIALALALTTALAVVLARLVPVPLATLVLGLAPGGVAEMCVTAKVLQLGVPVVTGFHVTRVAVLLLGTAPLFAAVRTAARKRRR